MCIDSEDTMSAYLAVNKAFQLARQENTLLREVLQAQRSGMQAPLSKPIVKAASKPATPAKLVAKG
jgi:hypothetical protein